MIDESRSKLMICELSRNDINNLMKIIVNLQNKISVYNAIIKIEGKHCNDNANEWRTLNTRKIMMHALSKGNTLLVQIQPVEGYEIYFPKNSSLLFVNEYTVNYGVRCPRIKTLIIDAVNWINVVTAEQMFFCTQIQNLVVKNQAAPNLVCMRQFAKLSQIEQIDLQSLDVRNVKDTQMMFSECIALKNKGFNISGIKLNKVEQFKQMLYIPFRTTTFIGNSDLIKSKDGLQGILNGDLDVRLNIKGLRQSATSADQQSQYLVNYCKKLGYSNSVEGLTSNVSRQSQGAGDENLPIEKPLVKTKRYRYGKAKYRRYTNIYTPDIQVVKQLLGI